jgi:hypothetical protein
MCTDFGICTDCPHGKISTAYNAPSCVTCANGQYAVAPATGCSDCATGQFHATTGSACTSCSGGKFAQAAKATSCAHCPSGQYQDGSDYATCDTCLGFSRTNSAQGPSQWTQGNAGQLACVDKPVDCFGNYFGAATMMACGCNDDTSCRDCLGNAHGSATVLACGCNDATSCDAGCGPNQPGPLACGCNDATSCLCVGPHYGWKDGVCRPSCGQLAGPSANSLWSGSCEVLCMADAGISYDMPVCCMPNGRPAPHYGQKNGQCLGSCGTIGGTSSSDTPCAWGTTDVGTAYDVQYCCN